MRLPVSLLLPVACATVIGCTQPTADTTDTGLVSLVAGITESNPADATTQSSDPPRTPSTLSGSITTAGDYQLFELGGGLFGDNWTITDTSAQFGGHSFLVALFDANYELLRREVLTSSRPLEHILRADAQALYLGVTPTYNGSGGDFRFTISRRGGAAVPAPQLQAVWLNFGGATDVRVHSRAGISFPAFNATMVGGAYADATAIVKAGIVAAMREDYAAFNVQILSSDDGPPPEGPYAVLHFGGSDARLLGLADNVDQYNANPWQVAMIYVEGFADFAVMNLTPEEMGQMVGNVASHELGHLLGLYHTRVPADLMDTTGTAWDLAADQAFSVADLERTVFPFGRENCPRRLAETVGENPDPPESGLAKSESPQTMSRKASLRAMARDLLHGRCGTCLDLDN